MRARACCSSDMGKDYYQILETKKDVRAPR